MMVHDISLDESNQIIAKYLRFITGRIEMREKIFDFIELSVQPIQRTARSFLRSQKMRLDALNTHFTNGANKMIDFFS